MLVRKLRGIGAILEDFPVTVWADSLWACVSVGLFLLCSVGGILIQLVEYERVFPESAQGILDKVRTGIRAGGSLLVATEMQVTIYGAHAWNLTCLPTSFNPLDSARYVATPCHKQGEDEGSNSGLKPPVVP